MTTTPRSVAPKSVAPTTASFTGLWLLALAVGLSFPILALGDWVLTDSYAFRIKGRILSLPELFVPGLQRSVVNPYYRPLFAALHVLFDRGFGFSSFGPRLLALACHAFAAVALLRYALTLKLSRLASVMAMLFFLCVPGVVATALWPVVGYWTLSAGFTYLAAASLVKFQQSGSRASGLATVGFAILGLLASQTPYHLLALGGWLVVLPPVSGSLRPRLRAAGAALLLAALAGIHLSRFAGAQALAQGSIFDRLQSMFLSLGQYYGASLGGDARVGLWWAPLLLGLPLVAATPLAGRRGVFLLGAALIAPLPFAGFGFAERYAYFACGIVSMWSAAVLVDGLGRRGRVGAVAATVLGLALLGLHIRQAAWVHAEFERAAARVEQGDRDLAEILPQVAMEDVAFINAPQMLRLSIGDQLEINSVEQLPLIETGFNNFSMFATDTVYYGPADFSDKFTHVVEGVGGRLVLRDSSRPMGAREARSNRWFLARDVELFETPEDLPWDARRQNLLRRAYLEQIRRVEDPEQTVLLEWIPEGLTRPLGRGQAMGRYENETPRGQRVNPVTGERFLGRLILDLDLDRTGFLVIVAYFAAEDPVAEISGTMGRSADKVEATLDGEATEIVPAFYHLSGIVVPAGRHQVVVRERN